MGVVTGLLLAPITGPVRAFWFLLERLRDEAEAVLRDEGRAFAELIDLSMRHTAGQLSDEEYAEQETELLERLNSIRDYRNELLSGEVDEDELPYDEAEDDELYDETDEEAMYAEPDEEQLAYGEVEVEGMYAGPDADEEDG